MPISNWPVMDADYPLFDWGEWTQSWEVLVPGGETRLFQKECWNDMVFKLNDAVVAAGMEWHPDYTNDPRLSDNGFLLAEKYNAMVFTMQEMVPLRLTWWWWFTRTRDEDKYIKELRREPGMIVKPEHITAIAERLNLTLGILRGSIDTPPAFVRHKTRMTSDMVLSLMPSRPLPPDGRCWTHTDSEMEWLYSRPMAADYIAGTVVNTVKADVLKAVPAVSWHTSRTSQNAAMRYKPSCPFPTAKMNGRSHFKAELLATMPQWIQIQGFCDSTLDVSAQNCQVSQIQTGYLAASQVGAEMKSAQPFSCGADKLCKTGHHAEAHLRTAGPGTPVELYCHGYGQAQMAGASTLAMTTAQHSAGSSQCHILSYRGASAKCSVTGYSKLETDFQAPDAIYPESHGHSISASQCQAITRTARPAWADGHSRSGHHAVLQLLPSEPVESKSSTKTNFSATVHLPEANPLGPNVISAVQSGCTLELIRAAALGTAHPSKSVRDCRAGIWLLPLRMDTDTIHIRQTYQKPIKVDSRLYIDHWPDQGITEEGTLLLWRVYDMVLQVDNALYIGVMPSTGMVDPGTLLLWDVSQAVQTLTLLEVY